MRESFYPRFLVELIRRMVKPDIVHCGVAAEPDIAGCEAEPDIADCEADITELMKIIWIMHVGTWNIGTH
jgi:hypothetical protein